MGSCESGEIPDLRKMLLIRLLAATSVSAPDLGLLRHTHKAQTRGMKFRKVSGFFDSAASVDSRAY